MGLYAILHEYIALSDVRKEIEVGRTPVYHGVAGRGVLRNNANQRRRLGSLPLISNNPWLTSFDIYTTLSSSHKTIVLPYSGRHRQTHQPAWI